jgi:hypothetical protein
MSDKFWNAGEDGQGFIRTRKEDYYDAGSRRGLQKYSIINEKTLTALSNNIFSVTIELLYEDMFKYGTMYYHDPDLKRKYSVNQLKSLINIPKTVTINDPLNPAKGKDTIINTKVPSSFFKSINWNTISVGLVTDSPDQKTIYLSKEDLSGIIPLWMKELILLSNQ